jgi:hypothetical protein
MLHSAPPITAHPSINPTLYYPHECPHHLRWSPWISTFTSDDHCLISTFTSADLQNVHFHLRWPPWISHFIPDYTLKVNFILRWPPWEPTFTTDDHPECPLIPQMTHPKCPLSPLTPMNVHFHLRWPLWMFYFMPYVALSHTIPCYSALSYTNLHYCMSGWARLGVGGKFHDWLVLRGFVSWPSYNCDWCINGQVPYYK